MCKHKKLQIMITFFKHLNKLSREYLKTKSNVVEKAKSFLPTLFHLVKSKHNIILVFNRLSKIKNKHICFSWSH